MSDGLAFAIVCGLLALVYGIWAVRSVMSESPGNERMQEIAAAVQLGAKAFLNRQYLTISAVGVVIFVILLLRAKVSLTFYNLRSNLVLIRRTFFFTKKQNWEELVFQCLLCLRCAN